jgi:hypothetical protein
MPARRRGDQQVEILRAIWTEMKALNGRVDQTNARLDQANARLDQTNVRLDAVRSELRDEIDGLRRRMVESEVRLATATTQLAADVQTLTGLIREWREEHRADRAELRVRVARLEEHAGLTGSR